MSKSCLFILPYFGKFKNYFPLFLRSCGMNPEYDWLIVTDQDIENAPGNVSVVSENFGDFKAEIQSKFDFPISLENPYKLCDFKPAYGYVLESRLAGYDYWGHCDCDMLFGNMPDLLEPLLAKGYDKLFAAGHLTIYRNDYENNRRFMARSGDGLSMHRVAFSRPEIFAFDEMFWGRNVHNLFLEQGASVFSGDLSFNVSTRYWCIRREYFDQADSRWKPSSQPTRLLEWKEGCIQSFEKGYPQGREWLYAHLQQRSLDFSNGTLDADAVEIGPDFLRALPTGAEPRAAHRTAVSLESLRRGCHRVRDRLRGDDPLVKDPYAPYINEGGLA
jgi:hypothetical protein